MESRLSTMSGGWAYFGRCRLTVDSFRLRPAVTDALFLQYHSDGIHSGKDTRRGRPLGRHLVHTMYNTPTTYVFFVAIQTPRTNMAYSNLAMRHLHTPSGRARD